MELIMKRWKKAGLFTMAGIIAGTGIWMMRPRSSSQNVQAGPDNAAHETSLAASSLRQWLTSGSMDISEGIALARERGAMMRELISADPEEAIRQSLSLYEWSALPAEIRQFVEQPFSAMANVEVLIACGIDSSETMVNTELSDSDIMETHLYGLRAGMGSKRDLPVQGIRIGEEGVLRAETFQWLDGADEAVALSLYPVVNADPGGDSAAALAGGRVFYFKNRAALDEANARMAVLEERPGPGSGAQVLIEQLDALVIDGQIDFNTIESLVIAAAETWGGTARDMYVIMVDFSDIPGAPTDPAAFSNSLNTTVAGQISEMSYEKTYIMATVNTNTYRMPQPSSVYTNNSTLLFNNATSLVAGVDFSSYETVCVLFPDIPQIWWAGLASINGSRLWLNGNTSTRVVTHELGHNYGSSHASSWEVPGSNPADPAGSYTEYGDFSDIMGSASLPEGHFNCWHKKKIGWLDATNWQAVATSGAYRLYRSDNYQTTGAIRGLEIDKGAGDQYWVGLRQEFPEYETFSRGAYLLWKKSGDNRSYLLDTSPLSDDGGYDGGLALGQTYSDASAGVHITPVARGGQAPDEWMDFMVNLGTFAGNSAPAASLSGPGSGDVQLSMLFSVSASDVDGDELAYYWDTGDGLVKPNSPTIATAWLAGGTTTVSCVVSDMKGGTNRVSQNVVISNPLENWTQRTSGTTAKLNDIAYGNGRLVAVGRDWKVVYSDNGIDWTAFTFGYPYAPYFEGIVFDGAAFVAVGLDYDGAAWGAGIYTSTDGATWVRRFTGGTALNDVAYGDGVYVAVGGGGAMLRSTNSVNWSAVATGTTTDLRGISYGDGTFVAVGDAGGTTPHVVLTSTDGLSWADQSDGVQMYVGNWLYAVEYCNDRFLAGGWNSEIFGSTDQGDSFDYYISGALNLESFAYGHGNYFAAGQDIDHSNADINLVSVDGANWTVLPTPVQDDRNAVIYYNGTFITVGDNGAIWQSDSVGAAAPGYAMWQLENAEALGLDRDPHDDADFDGYWNLWEYAMGSLATDAGSVPAAGQETVTGGYFTVSYARDGIAPDVDYSVVRASSLMSNDWNAANTVVLEDTVTNLTARSVFPLATQTNEFMRLNIGLTE